jgi:hypothetical protein
MFERGSGFALAETIRDYDREGSEDEEQLARAERISFSVRSRPGSDLLRIWVMETVVFPT